MTEAQKLAQALEQQYPLSGIAGPAAALLRAQEAEIAALKAQLQEQALEHLASEGQWIERTGKLEAAKAELLGALQMIAGEVPCIDNLLSDKAIARVAITKHKDTP